METFLSYFFLAIILFIIYIYYEGKYSDVGYVKSTIDEKFYIVRNLKDKLDAANMIAEICIRLKNLCDHLVNKFPDNDVTSRILKRFNPSNISEGAYDIKYTSYYQCKLINPTNPLSTDINIFAYYISINGIFNTGNKTLIAQYIGGVLNIIDYDYFV